MKKHLFSVAVLALVVTLTTFTGCRKPQADDNTPAKEGLYLGIVGFNSELYTMPLGLLNQDTKHNFESFVDGLSMQNGTILYHAVNTGLNSLATAKIPENLINVSVVTFTDGLDQGSLGLSDNYNSNNDYLTAINSRINNELIGGNNISAYSIGVRGADVIDIESFRDIPALLNESRRIIFPPPAAWRRIGWRRCATGTRHAIDERGSVWFVRFHQLAPYGLRDGAACVNDDLRFKDGSAREVQRRDPAALALGGNERSTRHHTATACFVQHLPHQPRHRIRIENDTSAVGTEPLLVNHSRTVPPERRGIWRVVVNFKKRSRKLRSSVLLRPGTMVDETVHARLTLLFQTFIDKFRQTSRTAYRFPGTDTSNGGRAAKYVLAFHQHDIHAALRRRPGSGETGRTAPDDSDVAR